MNLNNNGNKFVIIISALLILFINCSEGFIPSSPRGISSLVVASRHNDSRRRLARRSTTVVPVGRRRRRRNDDDVGVDVDGCDTTVTVPRRPASPSFPPNDDGCREGEEEEEEEEANNANATTRRGILLRTMMAATTTVALSSGASATNAILDRPSSEDDDDDDDDGGGGGGGMISVPLEYIPALNAYVAHYYLFGERFGAIVDTGSPFLTVPSTCSAWSYKYKWGCYHPEKTFDSGLSNTIEGFDNNQGTVVWRKAGFAFDGESRPEMLTFGVFGPDLLDGPGGVFLGLIRDTDRWIRPSFLGQTGYSSFRVDLRRTRSTPPRLVLSKKAMIRRYDDDYIPLVRDLNRRYGAPVVHYAARASGFVVNGLPLKLDVRNPTYVIFDTGLSGMAVSDELFEGRNLQARKNREKSLWGEVAVSFETRAGGSIELRAAKPITTPLGKDTPWTRVKGNLIVLGLAFLDGTALTIDIDDGKLEIATEDGVE